MAKLLEGKVAVVTGSGRGIGRETVLLMAGEGAKVVVNDLGTAEDGSGGSTLVADRVVAEIKEQGGDAVANYASVATAEGAGSLVQTAIDHFGRIDIMVNNAGILRDRMLWNMTDEEWDEVIKVHLYGHFYCTRAALRHMRDAIRSGEQGNGRVINLTSEAGFRGNAGQVNYGAAKMGVIGFTYCTSLACERLGITCNAVAPRAVTRLTDTIPDDRLRQLAKTLGSSTWDTPDIDDLKAEFIGGPPASIVPLIAWLASDEAQHVTGQVFMITKGTVGILPKMQESKTVCKDGLLTLADIPQAMQILVPRSVHV